MNFNFYAQLYLNQYNSIRTLIILDGRASESKSIRKLGLRVSALFLTHVARVLAPVSDNVHLQRTSKSMRVSSHFVRPCTPSLKILDF